MREKNRKEEGILKALKATTKGAIKCDPISSEDAHGMSFENEQCAIVAIEKDVATIRFRKERKLYIVNINDLSIK
jgi:hypothetical protein